MLEDKRKLNPEQEIAVKHGQGPLLIVAGAGTGKTTVLIERLLHLIESKKARPDEILVVTFTEKATQELEERADKKLPMGYVDLWISTFHGLCERILRDHALDIGLPGDFKILNDTDQWILIRRNLDKFDLDYYRPLGNPTKFIHELLRHFSRLKDEYITREDYLAYAEELRLDSDTALSGAKNRKMNSKVSVSHLESKLPAANRSLASNNDDGSDRMEAVRINELANAYHAYNQLLLDGAYLDFGDLIFYTIKLFQERPNILKEYRDKFKYIMVDEFQDTNIAQYELIKLLAAPADNLVVVGDDDQSIYKFRGASLSNIMQFKDDFPDAREVVLTRNYRCGADILESAYKFISHNNPNRLEIKLGIDKNLKAERGVSGHVEHLHFGMGAEETKGVVEKIIEIRQEDESAAWSDFAILIRANDTADKFINELTRAGIPNQFVSLKGLYYKPIILDLIAYLKLIDNHHESSALYRVLNMDAFRVGHEDIININKFAKRKVWTMFEALGKIAAITDVAPEAVANINNLLSILKKHAELAKTSKTSRVVVQFLNESGVLADLDHDRDAEVFSCLNQFYRKIKKMEDDLGQASLKDVIETLEMEMDSGETGSLKIDFEDEEAVKVMTVHASKGQEYKYVFIVNVVDKKFPTVARSEKISIPDALVKEHLPEGDIHTEEERRLFYVAMTRAKDKLFLTTAADYGLAREKKPSKFLDEAGIINQAAVEINSIRYRDNELVRDLIAADQEAASCEVKYKIGGRYSFSKLEAFSNCPLQFKYAHILKIPVIEKINFIFGKVIHATLRDFLAATLVGNGVQSSLFGSEDRKKPAREELFASYEKHWENDGYADKKQREEYKKKGRKIFEDFYSQIEKNGWPDAAYLEKAFTVKVAGYSFNGAIDRIDRLADGTFEIIDYKTGNPKDKLDFGNKKQLILYKLAAEEVLGIRISQLSYYYLENGSKQSFEATEKDMEKFIIEVQSTIEEMQKCVFVPKPGPLCAFCDFNKICEFRK